MCMVLFSALSRLSTIGEKLLSPVTKCYNYKPTLCKLYQQIPVYPGSLTAHLVLRAESNSQLLNSLIISIGWGVQHRWEVALSTDKVIQLYTDTVQILQQTPAYPESLTAHLVLQTEGNDQLLYGLINRIRRDVHDGAKLLSQVNKLLHLYTNTVQALPAKSRLPGSLTAHLITENNGQLHHGLINSIRGDAHDGAKLLSQVNTLLHLYTNTVQALPANPRLSWIPDSSPGPADWEQWPAPPWSRQQHQRGCPRWGKVTLSSHKLLHLYTNTVQALPPNSCLSWIPDSSPGPADWEQWPAPPWSRHQRQAGCPRWVGSCPLRSRCSPVLQAGGWPVPLPLHPAPGPWAPHSPTVYSGDYDDE